MSRLPLFTAMLTLAALALGDSFAEAQTASSKEILAVMELGVLGATEAQRVALSNQLRTELSRTGKVDLVDRSQMDAIMKEQALQQTGCTSQECAVQVGQLLGVRKIVTGNLTKVDDTLWQVAVQLLDVETGKILVQETFNHEGDYRTLLLSGMPKAAQALVGGEAPQPAPAVVTPAPPPPPPPPRYEPPPPEPVASGKPTWALWTGVILLALAGVEQSAAQSLADEANTDAEDAIANNDEVAYDEAQAKMDEAEGYQTAAIIYAGVGIGFIWYYAASDGDSTAQNLERAHQAPLALDWRPGGVWMGWRWRW